MPSWFPGARFKRYAREWRPVVIGAVETPYNKVKRELVSDYAGNSLQTTFTGLIRRPERLLPQLLRTLYRDLTTIQPRKTFGLQGLSRVRCIWVGLIQCV
jgi:hypothetical protein